jgi:multidrug efflux pump subunit AcrA (membrane-fusion protein)
MTDINFMKSTWCLLWSLLFGLLIALPTLANELTDRQYSVTEAQKRYDLEKTRYEDATLLVNEQKQRVVEEQALLEARQKMQAAAKASMVKAKAKLDAETRQLKETWDKSHH